MARGLSLAQMPSDAHLEVAEAPPGQSVPATAAATAARADDAEEDGEEGRDSGADDGSREEGGLSGGSPKAGPRFERPFGVTTAAVVPVVGWAVLPHCRAEGTRQRVSESCCCWPTAAASSEPPVTIRVTGISSCPPPPPLWRRATWVGATPGSMPSASAVMVNTPSSPGPSESRGGEAESHLAAFASTMVTVRVPPPAFLTWSGADADNGGRSTSTVSATSSGQARSAGATGGSAARGAVPG